MQDKFKRPDFAPKATQYSNFIDLKELGSNLHKNKAHIQWISKENWRCTSWYTKHDTSKEPYPFLYLYTEMPLRSSVQFCLPSTIPLWKVG